MAIAMSELQGTLEQARKRIEATRKVAMEAETRVSALLQELESIRSCNAALLEALGNRRLALQQNCLNLQKALSVTLKEKAALNDRLKSALEQTLWLQTEVKDLNHRLEQAQIESELKSKSKFSTRLQQLIPAVLEDIMNEDASLLLLLQDKHGKQISHCVHVLRRKDSLHAEFFASDISSTDDMPIRVSDELEELKQALEVMKPTLSKSKQSLLFLRNRLKGEYALPLAVLASSALAAIAFGYILKQSRH